MARVLIISFAPLSMDARVNRQINHFRADHDVTFAGCERPAQAGVDFIDCSAPTSIGARLLGAARLKLRMFEQHYWQHRSILSLIRQTSGYTYDLVVANDIMALPVALRVASGGKVIFDAHEYYPEEFEDRFMFRMFWKRFYIHLCRKYMHQADIFVTVGESIAQLYQDEFGVTPVVITNAPPRAMLEPGPIDPACIRVVHHGAAIRSRFLERYVEAVANADQRFQLDLYLTAADPSYLDELRRLASGESRVRVLPPIPPAELVKVLNGYDIGISMIPPTNRSLELCLPNKFFDFVQARLGQISGPTPDMAALIRRHGFGRVADGFTSAALTACLNSISVSDVVAMKAAAHDAAPFLCAEANAAILARLVEGLSVPDR